MGLVPELNEEVTINNVRKFFNSDKKYLTIKRNAWNDGLKSPVNDITGVRSSSRGNRNEQMMIYYAECAQAKRAVDKAISTCSSASRDILELRYIKQMMVYEVKERLNHNLGHTSYSDADKFACLEFAEACDRVAIEMNVDQEILPPFLEFKIPGTK